MTRVRDGALILALVACGSVLYHGPMKAAAAGPQQQQQQENTTPPQQQEATPPQTPATAAPAQTAPAQASDPVARVQTMQPVADQNPAPAPQAEAANAPGKLLVTVGKSLIIDSPVNIRRVHVANGGLAEAVAVSPKEVLINGTAPGETSLIVWQANDTRLVYDLTVRQSASKLEATRQQLAREFPADDISLTFENDTAFLRGKVKDVTAADRAVAIAASLGKVVNLLRVGVPEVAPQVLLKVKFADVDRSKALQFGLNLFNSSFHQQTSLGTGSAIFPDTNGQFTVPPVVNILLLRPDINLVAEMQALQQRNVLELLAEPNVLAISGETASFLAGGEFPFPVVQPSAAGTSAISIQWREYGVRLNFLPVVTPAGTIRLKVNPEVSSLDYTNAVTIQGFTIPGLSSRRVSTDVELDSGQSFVIAGLLDHQTTDNLSKVPGIGSIPIIGKLFQSRNYNRSNDELLVIITPEIVRPIPAGQTLPELTYPSPFLPTNDTVELRHPGIDKTGPVPVKPPVDSVPYEMLAQPKPIQQAPVQAGGTMAPAPQQQPTPTPSGTGKSN